MPESMYAEIDAVAREGRRLREQWRFDWPEAVQQTATRLRYDVIAEPAPTWCALIGGASSGKSTVFNNLLGGRRVSRIAARGHTTLGPILATHERHRGTLRRLIDGGLLLPDLRPVFVELDANGSGAPDELLIACHALPSLEDVWLFDLPDFTSESARLEGDITLSLLPWFDRLIVLVDHERWFDRQAISLLRAESVRFAHERFVLFNRTGEGELQTVDRRSLEEQARRLDAEMTVLEFRRGRGLVQFSPGTLEPVLAFVNRPRPGRREALRRRLAGAAEVVLNQNEERAARLREMEEALTRVLARTVPDARTCLLGLMTPAEKEQVAPIARILRLRGARAWIDDQAGKLFDSIGRIPVLGAALGGGRRVHPSAMDNPIDRAGVARAYAEAVFRRQIHELNRIAQGSAFWDEIRRWTSLEPRALHFTWHDDLHAEIEEAARTFDRALVAWLEKVRAECRGLSPHVRGAVGLGSLGLALVLIAAPGPVTALSLATAKTAVGAALAELLTAAGAGALFAKPMGRALAMMEENLLGTPEYHTVQQASGRIHDIFRRHAEAHRETVLSEASALVLEADHPLRGALQSLSSPSDTKP